MNVLSRDQQIQIIACLTEGQSIRTGRLELDEIWGYVGKKQKKVEHHELSHKGDQYVHCAGLRSQGHCLLSHRQA